MSRASQPDDAIYAHCLSWNVPALTRSGDADALEFVATLQLHPGRFGGDPSQEAAGRVSPLRRAALGMQAELSGNIAEARELYSAVARQPAIRGVLGCLLLAWMTDSTREDFARAEARLERLEGPGRRDVIARGHCKLAAWALDHGWPELARHHYDQAQSHAGKELGFQLEEIGHWFGTNQIVRFGRKPGEMTRFPWIVDFVDRAAQQAVESQFLESFKSPWRRTWTIGAQSVEGTDIQAAELQASWAGALWLLPPIQRQHAALIFAKSREPEDITRAIALWIRGGGKSANALVDAYEGHLTHETVADLMLNQLHSGRSVVSAGTWWETCHALWTELPDELVAEIVADYPGPTPSLRPHDDSSTQLSLFGKLLTRSKSAVEKAAQFERPQLAMLMRSLFPGLVARLDRAFLARGVRAALVDGGVDAPDEQWDDVGWAALALAWSLLSDSDREATRRAFVKQLPEHMVPEVAVTAPGLMPASRLRTVLTHEVDRVEQDLINARKGTYSGYTTEPATNIARLAIALGSANRQALETLVRLASSPRAAATQRQAALTALTSLAQHELVNLRHVSAALERVEVPASDFLSDHTDQAYEDIKRIALHLRVDPTTEFDGRLLAGSRDPSTRVRHEAVRTVQWLSIAGRTSPALDAALLGAMYDPHPRVQAAAVPALWRGAFADEVLRSVALERVLELWATAHLDLRVSVAHEVGVHDAADGRRVLEFRSRCEADRSALVRMAALPLRS